MIERSTGENCLTITEFSEFVGIPPKILRQYDREKLLCPAIVITKGKRTFRYYSPEQAPAAKVLLVLWSVGVQKKTISDYSKNRSLDSLLQLLESTMASLDNEMLLIQRARPIVRANIDMLQEGRRISEDVISIAAIPERHIVMGEINEYKAGEGYHRAYHRFCASRHKLSIDLSYKVGGYFESMKDFLESPSRPKRFYSLDPHGNDLIAHRSYLVGYTRGPYGETNGLPERMKEFADKNGLIFDGPVYNHYLIDELAVADPSQMLLQVLAALTDTSVMPNQRPLLHSKW